MNDVETKPLRRNDIQGLRALAVIAVIAYHAKLPIGGGFIGVDIFFVISGFVITAMLLREQSRSAGKISFTNFYKRRFLRLTPALSAVVIFSVIVSVVVLPPFGPQQNAGLTGIGAMFMVANGVISLTSGSYFAPPAEVNPLLHTWSLSVEEQFYVVFPALLFLSWRVSRHRFFKNNLPLIAVSLLTLVSFLITLFRPELPDTFLWGFYSPVVRAWEFGAGAVAAFVIANGYFPSRKYLNWMGYSGIVFILLSIIFITGKEDFPGPITLVPVIGTVLLLLAGSNPEHQSMISRMFGTKPLISIGNWSYSLYLWHWPLIVFLLVLFPDTPYIALIAAIISIVPAMLSYFFLENPLRKKTNISAKSLSILVSIFIGLPTILSIGVVWGANSYWAPKYANGEMQQNNIGDIGQEQFQDVLKSFYPCELPGLQEQIGFEDGQTRCRQTKENQDVTVALIGDSHAEQLLPGLAKLLPHTNIMNATRGEVPVSEASAEMKQIIDVISNDPTIQTVIINDYWVVRGVPVDALISTTTQLVEAGKNVYLLTGTADFSFDATICKYQRGLFLGPKCSENSSYYFDRVDPYLNKFEEIQNEVPKLRIVNTSDIFCEEGSCSMLKEHKLMFRDIHHLNLFGSDYVARHIMENSALYNSLSAK